MTAPALSAAARRAVWRRQFLLQGCWNYEGMQNVGFAYAILPALREFYAGRPEDALKAVKRHLEFFNTQPAMGAVILGAAVRLEERASAGDADARSIGTFKVGLMGSLGAIGDAFFWGALRPMASAAGAILALLHPLAGSSPCWRSTTPPISSCGTAGSPRACRGRRGRWPGSGRRG